MKTVTAAIVGSKHHPGALDLLATLADDAVLTLLRQPDNPHDRNAIAVLSGLVMLGFVPAFLARAVAPLMDNAGVATVPGRLNSLDRQNCSVTFEVPAGERPCL